MTFTPGPWTVHPQRAWVVPVANPESPVCAVRHPAIDVPEDEAIGNAMLIACAPDLLSALRELVDAADHCVTADDDMSVLHRFAKAVEVAREVMALAIGEES